MEFEVAGAAIVNGDTENIRWQQVAGELHALKGKPKHPCKNMGQGGLAVTGNVSDQKMTAGDEAGESEPDFVLLAQNHIIGPGDDAGELRAQR